MVKNFIRVVILDPQAKGHVIQRMRNPKIAMVRYLCTAKRPTYDTASISESTTPINIKFQDNIWTTKMWQCSIVTSQQIQDGGRPPF